MGGASASEKEEGEPEAPLTFIEEAESSRMAPVALTSKEDERSRGEGKVQRCDL
jgi:hypothetical protein